MRKIIDLTNKETYEIDPTKSGENHMACPSCSSLHPSSAKKKCFSWNDQKRTGKCHRCDASFVEAKEKEFQPTYERPTWEDKTDVTEAHLKWMHSRKISNEAILKAGVYSDSEFMPQFGKVVQVVCFPFFREGKVINIKYRGPKKSFKLVKGAEKILFNLDRAKKGDSVIIVEGEMDALAYLTCGIEFVVSVPNGANKNLDYLDSAVDFFEQKETVILAVDADPKGVELQTELARRIGPEKCKVVDFKDCKDANEYLQKYGGPELFKTVKDSTDYPVSGVFGAFDIKDQIVNLWLNGLKPGLSIGSSEIDSAITWEQGRLAVVTGIPSHGKSEFVDYITCKLNLLHEWKCAYFSPENHPMELHYAKLAEKFTGVEFGAQTMRPHVFDQSYEYLRQNFFFIAPENEYTVDSILSRARYLVKRHGIKVLVIDPYNRLDHQYDGMTETKYISDFLDKLTNFCRLNGVLIFLVAHPVKMYKENGAMPVPTLYSINGSSNFYNKADYGFTVYRKMQDGELINAVEVHVQKVKFKHLGRPKLVEFNYNYKNGRFEPESVDGVNGWDNSNWLSKPEDPIKPNTSEDDIPF